MSALDRVDAVIDFLFDDALSLDNGLHATAAALALWAGVHFNDPWVTFALGTLFGWLREIAQHRVKGNPLKTWFGWWTIHRAVEGVSWGFGAGVMHALIN